LIHEHYLSIKIFLVQKNGHHKKIRHYKKTVTIKLKSDTMVSSNGVKGGVVTPNGVKGGVVTPNGEKKGLRNALSTLLLGIFSLKLNQQKLGLCKLIVNCCSKTLKTFVFDWRNLLRSN
jgi:hypothetical protein